MNIVNLVSLEEKATGLIGMKPIPADTLFVFANINPGQQFHSNGVLEPFEIYFMDARGRKLSGKILVPPHDVATAPAGTNHVIEKKLDFQ